MTHRQEIIEELATEFTAQYDRVNRSMVSGFVELIYKFDFVAEKYPGILEYSRPHLEGAIVRRVEDLLEKRTEERPELVNVVTGERHVGPKGMSADNYFEARYS